MTATSFILVIYICGGPLTMGPYRSAGMCIMNYAPPEINVVVIAKALFHCLSRCEACYVRISTVSQLTA